MISRNGPVRCFLITRSCLQSLACMVFVVVLTSCAAPKLETPADPDGNLKLVVTDLVSAMVQIGKLNPLTTTVRFAQPDTHFGVLLLHALEGAGYGIQLSTASTSEGFVSYALRSAETEAGLINDYLVSIDGVEVRREYNTTSSGIYPSSLMFITGSTVDDEVILDDRIFAEQGGDQAFLSGIDNEGSDASDPGVVREVVADSNSRIVANRRTDQETAVQAARRRFLESQRRRESSDLAALRRYRKLVVIFPDNQTLEMGTGNKLAVRQLIDDFKDGDVFEISACDDFDGENSMSEERSGRIKEEFLSFAVPSSAIFRAPCIRANFRHQSDDSPTPVTIVQYRKP